MQYNIHPQLRHQQPIKRRAQAPCTEHPYLNSPAPAVRRLCAVDWLCSLALIKYSGEPTSAPIAPQAAPAARFRRKKAILWLLSALAPMTACTGAKRDSRVPFINTC